MCCPHSRLQAKATLARRLDIRTVGLSTRTDIAGGSVRLDAEFDVENCIFGELMPRLLLLRRLRELLYRSRQHGSKKRRVF